MSTTIATSTVTNDTIHEIVEDLGFDWYWAESHAWTPAGLTVTYWDDGEQHHSADDVVTTYGQIVHRHTSTATFDQLAHALAAIAAGTVTNDPYQVRAAADYLARPQEADGDYWTTDIVVQQAIFHTVVFG